MLKKISAVFICIIFFSGASYAAEQVKLLSYYPSPSGNYVLLRVYDDNSGTNSGLHFRGSKGATGGATIGDSLGEIGFYGYTGSASGTWAEAARIYALAADNFSASDSTHQADLYFDTDDGSGSGLQTRLFIDNTGNIGIGTTTPGIELHIRKDTDSSIGLKIENLNTGSNSEEGIWFDDENGTLAYIVCKDPSNTSYPNKMLIANNRPATGSDPAGSISIWANADGGSVNLAANGTSGTINITASNMEIGNSSTTSATYIRLTSPDGTKYYYVYVDNSGVLTASPTKP